MKSNSKQTFNNKNNNNNNTTNNKVLKYSNWLEWVKKKRVVVVEIRQKNKKKISLVKW